MTSLFQQSTFLSSIAIFQHYQHIEFTFLIHYYRALAQYRDFLDRSQLFMRKLLKQGYVASILRLSLQQFYGGHHEVVDCYEIFLSLTTMDLFPFMQYTSSTDNTNTGLDYVSVSNTQCILSDTRTAYPLRVAGLTPSFVLGSVVLISLLFCDKLCFFLMFCMSLSSVLCVPNVASVSDCQFLIALNVFILLKILHSLFQWRYTKCTVF